MPLYVLCTADLSWLHPVTCTRVVFHASLCYRWFQWCCVRYHCVEINGCCVHRTNSWQPPFVQPVATPSRQTRPIHWVTLHLSSHRRRVCGEMSATKLWKCRLCEWKVVSRLCSQARAWTAPGLRQWSVEARVWEEDSESVAIMLWLKPGVLALWGVGGIFTCFMMQSSQLFQSYRLPPFTPPPSHCV